MVSEQPDTLQAWLEAFLFHLRDERRLSSRTLESYSRDLNSLLLWLDDREVSQWTQLTQHHVRQYLAQRHAPCPHLWQPFRDHTRARAADQGQ